tara:strand:+ start:614 stop:829 length:216 start_codon:yes stop_codon:yes gene_type:complete
MKEKTISLEQEAKKYKKLRQTRPQKDRPLTARIYLAGQALAGLLASNSGRARVNDIKHEAFEWADKMLEDD